MLFLVGWPGPVARLLPRRVIGPRWRDLPLTLLMLGSNAPEYWHSGRCREWTLTMPVNSLEQTQRAQVKALAVQSVWSTAEPGGAVRFSLHVIGLHYLRASVRRVASGLWELRDPQSLGRRVHLLPPFFVT